MQDPTAQPDGVLAIAAEHAQEHCATVYLLVNNARVTVIDAGVVPHVRRVLDALSSAGLAFEAVDHVVLTHLHLDHAAGVGHLMAALPGATLHVHPRGLPHVVAPQQLWQANAAVYGEEQVAARYGQMLPVAATRVRAVAHGQRIDLAGRSLQVLHTPGHSRQHIALWDSRARVVFAGDAFGVCHRDLQVGEQDFVFPSTMPSGFDPDAMHASIDRLLALQPEAVYLGHGGCVLEAPRLAADLHRLVDAQVAVAQAARGRDVARHVEILAGLEQLVRDETARQGWALDEEAAVALMRPELEMNAQGLGVWLDTLAPEAVSV